MTNSYITVIGGKIPPHAIIIWTHKGTADQKRTVCYESNEVANMIALHNNPDSFRSKSHMHIFDASNIPCNVDGSLNDEAFWQEVEQIRQAVLNGIQVPIHFVGSEGYESLSI